MLWPGSLIVASERFPAGGVFIFALMAAGGDMGASVGPQLVGIASDAAIASSFVNELAAKLGMSVDAIGMKFGMLVGALFPIVAILVYSFILKTRKKYTDNSL